jgi:hypothetical protein
VMTFVVDYADPHWKSPTGRKRCRPAPLVGPDPAEAGSTTIEARQSMRAPIL